MNVVERDIKNTDYLFRGKNCGINRPYFNTNEDLNEIFSNFDIKGKNVLTVIGSGDQAFHFYNNDAKHVDLFDKNKIAIYYFYLRMWFIEYCDSYYPNYEMNNSIIKELLKLVEPKNMSEKIAYDYWSSYVNTFGEKDTEWLFGNNNWIGPNKLDKLDKLKKCIADRNFDISCVDISKESINGKKYDIIFKSNITDYVRIENFDFYLDNLDKHLSDNGIIISTNVLHSYPDYYEVKMFLSRFKMQEMPKIYDKRKEKVLSPGYIYTRK